MYGLEFLYQSGKRVQTKSQKILGVNSYFCRSYRGEAGRGKAVLPVIIHRHISCDILVSDLCRNRLISGIFCPMLSKFKRIN